MTKMFTIEEVQQVTLVVYKKMTHEIAIEAAKNDGRTFGEMSSKLYAFRSRILRALKEAKT